MFSDDLFLIITNIFVLRWPFSDNYKYFCSQMTIFCFCYTWWNMWVKNSMFFDLIWVVRHDHNRNPYINTEISKLGNSRICGHPPPPSYGLCSKICKLIQQDSFPYSFKMMVGDKLPSREKLKPEFPASPALIRSVQPFKLFCY